MKIREAISRIKNDYKEIGADSILSNRHIYNILNNKAKRLIKESANKKSDIYKQDTIFTNYIVPMEEVDILNIGFYMPVQCPMYRSQCKLPAFLMSNTGYIFKSITSLDKSTEFTLTTSTNWAIRAKSTRKYGNQEKAAFVEDGYLYTPNANFQIIVLSAVLSGEVSLESSCIKKKEKPKPNEVNNYNTGCGGILDEEFNCPEDLIDQCFIMAAQDLIKFKQSIIDGVTNKNDNEKNNTN